MRAGVWSRPLAGDPLPPGFHPCPDPVRPDAVSPGAWRRMSRLAKLACAAAAPVLAGRDDLDRLPLVWATTVGEFGSTAQFLRTLFTKGPAGASPLHFQNAVHNAPAGHLSIAFGLRGPSETICAGPYTTLRAIERALTMQGPVLVVVADDLNPDVQLGIELAGGRAPFGEGAAALIVDGDVRVEPCAGWSRRHGYPGEPDPDGALAHDATLGLYPACDAVALALGHAVDCGGARLVPA
ncbi:MAG: beta-ketoacyl synthase chain length factor [Myxococcota bacterium]